MDPLLDAFGRIRDLVPQVVDGLDAATLAIRPDGSGNSIAWLIWHLTRVQDDHLSRAAGTGQVWLEQGWEQRFGLDLGRDEIGYGHAAADVVKVHASAELLQGYHAAVADRTDTFVGGLNAADLDRVVDPDWDPPVTLGVRVVSVLADCLQHVGQAAYVRGLLSA